MSNKLNLPNFPTGCLIFDNPLMPTEGWYAQGPNPAKRIINIKEDLPANIYWLTNIPVNTFTAMPSDLPSTWFTQGYLREPLLQLAKRHNVRQPNCLAEFGAKVMQRLTALASSLVNDQDFRPYPSFKIGLSRYLSFPKLQLPPTIKRIWQEICSPFTFCNMKPVKKGAKRIIAAFLVPQREHCSQILHIPLPAGKFRSVKRSLAHSEEALSQFITSHNPGFYQVRVLEVDHKYKAFLKQGTYTHNLAYDQWLTSNELLFLSSYAKIMVQGVYLADHMAPLAQVDQLTETIPPNMDCVLTIGLFFDNFWHSFCVYSGGRHPIAAFLYAQDRLLLFDKVKRFLEQGAEVVGFGTGRIYVNVSELEQTEILDLAIATDTIPPCLHLSRPIVDTYNREPTPLALAQRLYALGNLNDLLDLDYAIVKAIVERRGLHVKVAAEP
ncbi:MAG: hypothetical protein IJU79_01230 [Desulfovibrionaceae bacterium]|nr:hypothetical protein [Desulfovibrionaceae bacterium]